MFFQVCFRKEARRAFALSHSTNGRSVRLKASVHRFQVPILQAYIGHRIHSYACTHVHAIHELSNNNRDRLLALSAAAAGKLARDGRLAGVNLPKVAEFPILRMEHVENASSYVFLESNIPRFVKSKRSISRLRD